MKTKPVYSFVTLAVASMLQALPVLMPMNVWAVEPVNQQIWVSPDGSDLNDGSSVNPFASLQKALTHVRTLRQTTEEQLGEIHIVMKGGTYYLTSSLQLTTDDSGTQNSPTIIEAAEGETVIVSGGTPIVGWQDAGTVEGLPEVAQGNVWKADAPTANGQAVPFRQMWVGNNKMLRASTFNALTLPRLITVDKSKRELTVPRIIQTFARPEEVEMTIIQDWVTNVMRVKSITSDGESSVLTFKDPESSIEFKRPWPILRADATSSTNHHFYLSNAIELLNQPQEWYCDNSTGTLYYWPRNREQQADFEAVVPILENIVNITGDGKQKVEHISFKGITFAHSSWLRPSQQGHVPLQAGQWLYDAYTDESSRAGNVAWVGRPAAAVSVSDARNISFEGCHFRQTASTGIDFVKGTKKVTVRGCTFSDIGGSAILAGYFGDETFEAHEPYNPEEQDVVCDSIIIDNNYMAHVATEDWGCLGICVGYASNTTISHNEIYDTPYSSISMGWGWTKETNCMHNNHITANYLHSFCNQIRDGGAIYTLSSQPESSVEGNRIEDVGNPQLNPLMWENMAHAQFDIYLDEGSNYFTVRNNWCERGEISKNKNGNNNVWGTNNNSVDATYKDAAGLEADYLYIKNSVTEPDMAPTDSIIDYNDKTLEYPTERIGGMPVTQLTDGEEYAFQNSNITLANRNLYWEWGTYLRTHSDGKIDDVTVMAHQHEIEGQTQWSFQITSDTGKGQYLGCTNGANVQVVGEEKLWIATYVESDGKEGNGFILLPADKDAGKGHEMVMNGSADWVVAYDDGTSTDRTDNTSHWSFIRIADLNSDSVTEYNANNLKLYQYLVEARHMNDRGITSMLNAYEEGLRIYNKSENTAAELKGAIHVLEAAITASTSNYEEGIPATYGIINPSFENLSSQHNSDRSVPFGWTMTKDGNVVTSPTDWAWCGCNADGQDKDGTYIWGVWNGEDYGNIELSQTISGLTNGLWMVSARLMNNNTENGNLCRIFANNNSMLAGGAIDYETLPDNEYYNYGNTWASTDGDMSHIMTAYTQVTDGKITIGARSNGFFKIDDFRLTYLGDFSTVGTVIDSALTIAFNAPVDLTSASDVKAYKMNNDGSMTEVTGSVAAGQPVLLTGETGTYDFHITTQASTADMTGNALRVANGHVKVDGSTMYVLANKEKGLGFYLSQQDTLIESGNVYLLADYAKGKDFIPITLITNHIATVESADNIEEQKYDLSGRKVTSSYRGIVVVDGKKFYVP